MVRHEDLDRFIRDVLKAKGTSEADAALVADGLVWANLRGTDGHGVSRLPRYIRIIERGEIDTRARPRLTLDRAAAFVLDCGHCFGAVAMMQALPIAVERAKAAGSCYGLLRETTHTGAIGRYAQWMAEHGCAAIIMGGGPALMAYHGTRAASLATSPIAMAVPSGRGPIVLDMATSTISNGKILQALATGGQLPEGTVLTAEGEATTDPNKAEIVLPLGGPKGSGTRPDVRAVRERSCRVADPVACAWAREANASHQQHRDHRRRYRDLSRVSRFRARYRYAGRHAQGIAATKGI